jgi:hypothetical protein
MLLFTVVYEAFFPALVLNIPVCTVMLIDIITYLDLSRVLGF